MSVLILEETTEFPLQKIGRYAGICWNSPSDDEKKNIERAKECIRSGHGRVMEYIDIELVISGYSARCIREYYTHTGGSPTRLQESTRYVDYSRFDFYIPDGLNDLQLECYIDGMMKIQDLYSSLAFAGISREDCANILPLGMMTKIVDKRNLRNMVNLMNQRLCNRAYREIRNLAKEIKKELSAYSEEWAWICANLFVSKCDASGFCSEKNGCGYKVKK